MGKSKEQDELIEFLLEQNWRLTKRVTAVSAKSNRKSRHIKNLVKGLENSKLREYRSYHDAETTERLYLEEMVKAGEARLELEQAELRISELSYENAKAFKDNKELLDQQEYLNSVIALKEQQIQRITSIETTKDKDLEKKLSNDDLLILAGACGCGMVLGIVGVVCLVTLS